jgi:hypothetical protein
VLLQGESELETARWAAGLAAAHEAVADAERPTRVLPAADAWDGVGGGGMGGEVPRDLLDAIWADLDDVRCARMA